MAETTAKKSIAKEIKETIRKGECLICKRLDNKRRGLCMTCYQAFLRSRANQSKNERISWEESHIREGRILSVGQLREIKKPNPFDTKATA